MFSVPGDKLERVERSYFVPNWELIKQLKRRMCTRFCFSIYVDRGSLTKMQNKHIKRLFSNVLFIEYEEKIL